MPEKSFLVQKFAKLTLGQYHVIGYSVAGEESVVQIPELNVCFDIGRAPYFALTSDIVCITHSHMDHLAGLAYYLSQRFFQGMQPGTVFVPREIERPVDAMLRAWRDVERQGTPYKLIPISAGQMYEVRRDFGIRAYETHHGGPSLGYGLISIRENLKPELAGLTGPELVEMKKRGEEIQYRVEVPLVVYLGDHHRRACVRPTRRAKRGNPHHPNAHSTMPSTNPKPRPAGICMWISLRRFCRS